MLDANFVRTVTFMLGHDADGAVGVVLNRPSDTTVAEVLPGWGALAGPPAVVYLGCPVEGTEAMIGLAEWPESTAPATGSPQSAPLLGTIGSIDLACAP